MFVNFFSFTFQCTLNIVAGSCYITAVIQLKMCVQNTKQNTITMIAETFRKNIKRRCVYDTVSKNPNQKLLSVNLLGYLKVNYLIIPSNDTLPIHS